MVKVKEDITFEAFELAVPAATASHLRDVTFSYRFIRMVGSYEFIYNLPQSVHIMCMQIITIDNTRITLNEAARR